MTRHCSEADWKVFREVQLAAIDRYCARALAKIESTMKDATESRLERLERVSEIARRYRKDLNRSFLDVRRSTMFLQLCSMQAAGVLEADEIARFSEDVRERLARSAEILGSG